MVDNLIKNRLAKTADEVELDYDVILVVADYVDDEDGDDDAAFELAREDVDAAVAEAKDELREILGREVEVISCRFDEFDSGNVTHAGAHFDCKFIGTAADKAKIDEFYN